MRPGLFTIIRVAEPKIPENGEDSYSYYFNSESSPNGYIAVFDGCGGMGAKKYSSHNGKTGAYIASRTAAFVTDQFYLRGADGDLEDMLRDAFRNIKEGSVNSDGISIRSSLFRDFPTTAAIIETDVQENRLKCKFMWAGDSRCYYLDKKGVCQMTDDDVYTKEDAFTSLRSDAKMSNVISGDCQFRLNLREAELPQPVVVITATDGVFGYFSTPMHFEYMLLSTLERAKSAEDWKNMLGVCISGFTGDDYTFIAALFGFSEFKEVKAYFAERYDHLCKEYMKHCENAGEEKLRELWEKYKTDYYRR